jgi:arachidonate 5-lipoxygenase
VKGLPADAMVRPKKNGLSFQRISEFVQTQLNNGFKSFSDVNDSVFGKYINKPDWMNVANWKSDEEFCRQLIQGVNPMMITVCTKDTKIPPNLRNLTPQGKTVDELIDEKRLFFLDYELLAPLPPHADMVCYAPYVLIYKELPDQNNKLDKPRLMIAGIQLTREADESKNVVYTPASPPNRWLFAKIHVANSDNQILEFIYHLGFTHLAMEAHAIANHNSFLIDPKKPHLLGLMLLPHFQDAIGINYIVSILTPN